MFKIRFDLLYVGLHFPRFRLWLNKFKALAFSSLTANFPGKLPLFPGTLPVAVHTMASDNGHLAYLFNCLDLKGILVG